MLQKPSTAHPAVPWRERPRLERTRTCFPSPSGSRGRTNVSVVTPSAWVMLASVISWIVGGGTTKTLGEKLRIKILTGGKKNNVGREKVRRKKKMEEKKYGNNFVRAKNITFYPVLSVEPGYCMCLQWCISIQPRIEPLVITCLQCNMYTDMQVVYSDNKKKWLCGLIEGSAAYCNQQSKSPLPSTSIASAPKPHRRIPRKTLGMFFSP